MSTFDSFNDGPYLIRTEGQTIKISFERTGPSSGRISWTKPIPPAGCANEADMKYNGMLITVDTSHTKFEKTPTDGKLYVADPTADADLHAGDSISTALVVGAFYGDKNTVSMDITGLKPNTPYYVQGYAVDAQYRYHKEGVHAYSLDFGSDDEPDTAGTHKLCFHQQSNSGIAVPINSTTATGLIPGYIYQLAVQLDNKDDFIIELDGIDAPLYGQLVTELNKQFKLMENPLQSPVPPNAGQYYWNAIERQLYQWDGYSHVLQEDALIEPTDPSSVADGTFWFQPSTNILRRWTDSPAQWNTIAQISSTQDLSSLNCNAFWYDGTEVFQWEGAAWCELTNYNQSTDPSDIPDIICGTYWYDISNSILKKWNDENNYWVNTAAIHWDENPNALSNNTYWFDETGSQLFRWDGAWNLQSTAIISGDTPCTPGEGMLWYNSDLEELSQYVNGQWVELSVLVWPEDPTNRDSCDLWWNSLNDNLYVWESTSGTWVLTAQFLQQASDPSAQPIITKGSIWINNSGSPQVISQWDGSTWNAISVIDYATDPTSLTSGDIWYDTINATWFEWTGSAWSEVDPIDSDVDPQSILTGTLWFHTTTNYLFQRSGAGWLQLAFTTSPLTPSYKQEWFNISNNTLLEWDRQAWIVKPPRATVEITSDGCLLFSSTLLGSCSWIIVTDNGLFASVNQQFKLQNPIHGNDGLSGTPSYSIIGVGDDGTADERRELADSIRAQLGYPVVEVELTAFQMDTCIQGAIESLRKRSSLAYRRGFYFMDTVPGAQSYILTNKKAGYDKIVNITGIHRFTSAFLSNAGGGGAYGQAVLQHLYSMGTFDLTSFHLISQYVEQMEHLFATRVVYNWNETNRRLDIYQTSPYAERLLLDCAIERPEQDFFKDRFAKSWIERYASAQARMILAEIRGKYSSLPGAGGGVSLNVSDLIARADADMAECYQQLEDFLVNDPENWGIDSSFTMG